MKGEIVPSQYETILLRKNGKSVPVEISAAKTIWKGKPADLAIIRNNTEKKEAELKLKESEEWLSTTLKSIGDAVIATDVNSNIKFMNPVAEKLTGWTIDEVKSKKINEIFNIINEQSGKPAENPVERVIKEGVIIGLANHTILISKDGVKRNIEDSGAPIIGKDKKIIGVVLVFRDVSEEYAIKKKMSMYNHKMEILNKILIESNKAIDVSNLIDIILNFTLKLMDFDGGGIYLLDEPTRCANIFF